MSTPEPNLESLISEIGRFVVLTRQDVTQNQLDSAIWLWFTDEDEVSVCTLVSATLEILTQLGKKTGKDSHMYNKEMHQLLGKKLKKAPNFFKHASRDLNQCLKFHPASNEIFLIDALNLYSKIYGSLTPLMLTFRAWFTVFRGRATDLRTEELQLLLPKDAVIEDLITLNRREFLEEILPRFAGAAP
jgi:hypothetical protein